MRMRVPNGSTLQYRLEAGSVPEPNTGCWIWFRGIEGGGYPTIKVGKQTIHGNRASWEVYRGAIPPGLCVLHTCDNRVCVNPDHLFLGTKRDNAIDMVAKGRANRPFGDGHHASKLSMADVIAIRASRLSLGKLGAQYGVSKSTISCIRKGKTWRQSFSADKGDSNANL